jgi:hypothetical protein
MKVMGLLGLCSLYIRILFPNFGLQYFPSPEVDHVAKDAKFFSFLPYLSTTCSTHNPKSHTNEGFWGASKLTQKQQIEFLSVM